MPNPTFTIYTTPPVILPAASDLDDALSGRYGPVVIGYAFEQRDWQNRFIADLTTAVYETGGCTIHLDNDQPVSRTAAFVFRGDRLPASLLSADATRFNVAVFAVLTVKGVVQRLQLGLFHLDLPTKTQHANGYEEWQVKGSDLCFILADRSTKGPYTVPAASNYLGAVSTLCTGFGLKANLPTGTAVTPEAFTWAPGTPWLTIINDLLYGINQYPIWADNTGQVTTRLRIDPATEAAAIVYSTEGEPRMLVSPTARQQDVSRLNNWISVAIDDPLRAPALKVHTNNDPTSPLSITTSGKTNFLAITGSSSPGSKCVLDATTADDLCQFELRDQAMRAVSRTITTQPDPRRTNREWYTLDVEGYEAGTLWRVASWDYACAPGGPHTHTLELAKPVTLSNGSPPLTEIVQLINWFGSTDPTPLGSTFLDTTVHQSTRSGSAIVVVVMADTNPAGWAVGDIYAGPGYTLMASTAAFGIAGSHPVAGGGQCYLGIFLGVNRPSLIADGNTQIIISTGSSPYVAAFVAYEVAGIYPYAPLDGSSSQVQNDGGGANTLTAVDSGLTTLSTTVADLVIAAVGSVEDDSGFDGTPPPARTFTPTGGETWNPTFAKVVLTNPENGVYPVLYVNIQVATGAAQFKIAGTLGDAAAGTGALVAQFLGTTA